MPVAFVPRRASSDRNPAGSSHCKAVLNACINDSDTDLGKTIVMGNLVADEKRQKHLAHKVDMTL
jgi:hypothetical protein